MLITNGMSFVVLSSEINVNNVYPNLPTDDDSYHIYLEKIILLVFKVWIRLHFGPFFKLNKYIPGLHLVSFLFFCRLFLSLLMKS